MIANPQPYITREQYLEGEKNSLVKHEYIQGEVYAMAGASDAHITIAGNLCLIEKLFKRKRMSGLYGGDES
jgi:Uncharacterized protein conserved in cyanobacteria